jgi:choline transport protein
VAFLEGTIIQGLVIQNNPNYVPKLWHGTLLTWAVLVLPILCNLFARRILPALEIVGALGHIIFFLVIIITLAVLSPRSTASFVFTTSTTGLSGWSSPGIQWCIGLLSSAFPLGCKTARLNHT